MAKAREVEGRNERVLRLMQPPQLVVPVTGAGVSESAKVSGGRVLAAALIGSFDVGQPPEEPEPDLAAVVDHLLVAGVAEGRILEFVAARLASEKPQASPLIEALIGVPSRFVVTLNFDLSIETAERARGGAPVTLGNGRGDLLRALRALRAPTPPDELIVLHLHGSIERPEDMVLGGEGYARTNSDLVRMIVYELGVGKVLAFYGTTLDEVYLLALLEELPHLSSHVLWCREDERRALTRGRARILASRSNIYIGTVSYFEDLPGTLGPLLDGRLPQGPRVKPARVLHPDPGYVTNVLRDRRGKGPEDHVGFPLGPDGRRESGRIPTEDDVLDGLRTIVVGDPGSGKSELLRSLTSRSRGPRTGLFIRLADVDPHWGSGPRDTLAAWARTSFASRRGVDVSIDALDQGRFHFFLDGLDEVDSGLHDKLATLINRLATDLPQHAFTVSTRPLARVDLLSLDSEEASDWEQYALAPDVDWRDRYLAGREVSLEILEEEMPALRDMADVLITPFFLRHIVDLHEEGRLGDQRDIGDLLATLIDVAIEREHGKIDLTPGRARDWLRGLALATTISGTRTFGEFDLARLPVPGDPGGDPVTLARALEHRLLIAEEAGNFRFHHRLLGEQLAAEALVEEGPLDELRDCLVPYLDDELSGVRPDAAVTVGLACLRSGGWRAAVADRDPAAAARATPRDAPGRERSAALRTLWDGARASQVWIWERGTGLTDDAKAMSTLVRGLPGGRVAREMRRAIGAGTIEDQGNAIRVLSRALPEGLEPALRRVLRDGTRDGVVLRQAAIAAADCGFVGLVEDIVDMLVGQTDSAVHQDGVIALRRLTAGRPRPEFYRRLMAGPEADYLLALVHDELDPAEVIVLLAEYLRSGNDPRMLPRGLAASELLVQLGSRELKGDVLRAAVTVGVLLELDRALLVRLMDVDPEATLATLADLVDDTDDLGWFRVLDLAILYEDSELRRAGLPEEVIEPIERRRAIEAEWVAADAAGPAVSNRRRSRVQEEPEDKGEPPTLGALLEDSGTDVAIINNAAYFAAQVGDLDNEQTEELRRRLADWWPRRELHATITKTAPQSWTMEGRTAAWIRLGPTARPPLSDRRWGQLATCGILATVHTDWLRGESSVEGVYGATRVLAGALGAIPRLLRRSAPEPTPGPLRRAARTGGGFGGINSRLSARLDRPSVDRGRKERPRRADRRAKPDLRRDPARAPGRVRGRPRPGGVAARTRTDGRGEGASRRGPDDLDGRRRLADPGARSFRDPQGALPPGHGSGAPGDGRFRVARRPQPDDRGDRSDRRPCRGRRIRRADP